MILRINPRCDSSTKRSWILSTFFIKNINIQDPRQPYLMLNSPILIEIVVETIFVIRHGADHADDESTSTDGVHSSSRSEIGMFPEKTCIFFVDADGVFDMDCISVVTNI